MTNGIEAQDIPQAKAALAREYHELLPKLEQAREADIVALDGELRKLQYRALNLLVLEATRPAEEREP